MTSRCGRRHHRHLGISAQRLGRGRSSRQRRRGVVPGQSQIARSISVFEPEMDQQIRDRRVLHQDLSVAIRNGELSFALPAPGHFGPNGPPPSEVIGFEALARWMHPVRGFVSPGDFIPLAEESGLIVEMGEWILREACREAASWPVPLQIAVNLSPAQFMHGDVGQPGTFDPARNRAGAGSARTRNHRRRADRGFRSRPGVAAAAEGGSARASRWTISAAVTPR